MIPQSFDENQVSASAEIMYVSIVGCIDDQWTIFMLNIVDILRVRPQSMLIILSCQSLCLWLIPIKFEDFTTISRHRRYFLSSIIPLNWTTHISMFSPNNAAS